MTAGCCVSDTVICFGFRICRFNMQDEQSILFGLITVLTNAFNAPGSECPSYYVIIKPFYA